MIHKLVKYKEREVCMLNAFLQPSLSLMTPSLILEGGPSTGKTFTLNKYLEYLKNEHAIDSLIIECEFCFTQREVIKKIHKSLMVYYNLAFSEYVDNITICDNISTLPVSLKQILKYEKKISSKNDKKPLIIVLDKIDKLVGTENPGELIKCLTKIHELDYDNLNKFTFVNVVTRSDILDISTLSIPTIIFNQYKEDEFRDIINMKYSNHFWDFALDRKRENDDKEIENYENEEDINFDDEIKNGNEKGNEAENEQIRKIQIIEFKLNDNDKRNIFKQFVDIILDTYSSYLSKNIENVIPIITKIWPIFVDPILKKGEIIKGNNDIFTTFMKNKSLLSKKISVVTKLENSEISLIDYQTGKYKLNENMNENSTSNSSNNNKFGNYDLSIKTKYLVIASFLASYNESKFDKQFFSKHKDNNSIFKNRVKRIKKSEGIGKLRRDISAALPFKLERLLAILRSIWIENVGDEEALINDVELMTEIATLSSLKTLIKIKGGDTIGGQTKWKCNVPWNIVKKFSDDVGFEIENHLQD